MYRVSICVLLASACASETSQDHSKRVFVTKLGHDGSFGGIAGADGFCTQAATAANLGGTWVAWLSDSTTNAIDRITASGPWKRVGDDSVVFNNRTNIMTLPIVPIANDENGEDLGNGCVWTGTAVGGDAIGSAGMNTYCSDWTSNTEGSENGYGASHATDDNWTASIGAGPCGSSPGFCGNKLAIYCFEQ